MDRQSESIVCNGYEKSGLRYGDIVKGSLRLRKCTFPNDEGNIDYTEGTDYAVDYAQGRLWRLPGSRIPDWKSHVMHGRQSFDHAKYSEYSNEAYTVYADYATDSNSAKTYPYGEKVFGADSLTGFYDKLNRGTSVYYVVYGDSISTGAEVSRERCAYYNRFADRLRDYFDPSQVKVRMRAKGGETSAGGLERLHEAVLGINCDLISIAYGMNDQNKVEDRRNLVSPEQYESNISAMVETIRDRTEAAIILITPCVPNPRWKFASGDHAEYSNRLKRLGNRLDVCVVDLQAAWTDELKAGKSHQSLLLNNINHPNDYGHWLYFKSMEATLEQYAKFRDSNDAEQGR